MSSFLVKQTFSQGERINKTVNKNSIFLNFGGDFNVQIGKYGIGYERQIMKINRSTLLSSIEINGFLDQEELILPIFPKLSVYMNTNLSKILIEYGIGIEYKKYSMNLGLRKNFNRMFIKLNAIENVVFIYPDSIPSLTNRNRNKGRRVNKGYFELSLKTGILF